MTHIILIAGGVLVLVILCIIAVWVLGWGLEKRKQKIESEIVKLKEDTIGALVEQHDAVTLLSEVNKILKAEYGYQNQREGKNGRQKRKENGGAR